MFDLSPILGWQASAVCDGAPQDLFFPERGQPARAAKAMCAVCPVAPECLAYAVENEIDAGIWGGQSPHERKALRRSASPRPVREIPTDTH